MRTTTHAQRIEELYAQLEQLVDDSLLEELRAALAHARAQKQA